MSNIVTVGYTAEGPTDQRFLEAIINTTVEEIAFACDGLIQVFDPVFYVFPKTGFVNGLLSVAKEAHNNGIHILCVHTDADDLRDIAVFNNKVNPALKAINEAGNEICNNIVPIVPIRMSEAWMLADKELLKSEIGTTLSDNELYINRDPETIADPKSTIINAIRIAQSDLSKKRDMVTIGELYMSMGQKIKTEDLERLSSYRKFKAAMKESFIRLNYLHE
jgi:hypothetical protein